MSLRPVARLIFAGNSPLSPGPWLKIMALSSILLIQAACGVGGRNGTGETAPIADEPAPGSFVFGDLLEPFTPPSLEELDAQVEWIEQPVLDPLELLRRRQEKEEPMVSIEEALQMRNDSPEANAKILSALGRLPANMEEVDWNASITRHTPIDVRSTNPLMTSSVAEGEVNGLTGFGLFSYDWDFNFFAASDVVVSWHSSEDRLFDKVIMRDDLTWSDGHPITARDIVFSFKTIMSSAVPVPAQRSGTEELRWIEAYDDQTLVFFHKEPLATNPWHLNFYIIPRHIYEQSIFEDPTLQNSEYHVRHERNPITGGPYIIHHRIVGREIMLKRRESWHMHEGKQARDPPFFDQIRFLVIPESSVALLALKAGDLDEKILNPEEWQTQTDGPDFYRNNTKAFGLEWVYFYFGWNHELSVGEKKMPNYFFSDRRVRKAMSYAFDHEEMHNILLYGLYEPANGIFHPTSRWAPEDPPPPFRQDLDMAEKLLEEAGWVDTTGDGIRDKEIDGRRHRFEFSILVANIPDRVAICNLLRQNLSEIGIICHVRPLEFTVLQEKTLRGDFHAFFGGWGTGAYPDTNENIWKSGAPRNFVGYSNPEVDKLFELAIAELNEEKRRELFARIHLLIYEDQPYTWLFFRNSFYGFNKSLRGYNFSPRGPYSYGPGFGSIWKPAL
jgi:peptide/nickel transport system substrate-binding protein